MFEPFEHANAYGRINYASNAHHKKRAEYEQALTGLPIHGL
jgi:hypothetical protein